MKGHGQDRINYVKSLVNLFDIIIVQEHWYLNCQLQEFQNNFNNPSSFINTQPEIIIMYIPKNQNDLNR